MLVISTNSVKTVNDMDKIARIRQEIERLKKGHTSKEYRDDAALVLEDLEDFLDTLSEEPDKSLEEEVKRYLREEHDRDTTVRNVARHFAEWQKSQMLREAYVESQIVEDGRIELEGDPLPCLNPIILLPYPQFNPGDKVRVLVLKAEEE